MAVAAPVEGSSQGATEMLGRLLVNAERSEDADDGDAGSACELADDDGEEVALGATLLDVCQHFRCVGRSMREYQWPPSACRFGCVRQVATAGFPVNATRPTEKADA